MRRWALSGLCCLGFVSRVGIKVFDVANDPGGQRRKVVRGHECVPIVLPVTFVVKQQPGSSAHRRPRA